MPGRRRCYAVTHLILLITHFAEPAGLTPNRDLRGRHEGVTPFASAKPAPKWSGKRALVARSLR